MPSPIAAITVVCFLLFLGVAKSDDGKLYSSAASSSTTYSAATQGGKENVEGVVIIKPMSPLRVDEQQEAIRSLRGAKHQANSGENDDDDDDHDDGDDDKKTKKKTSKDDKKHDIKSPSSAEKKHQHHVNIDGGDDEQARRICHLPADTGLCKAFFPRFFFDPSTSECKKFIYGGCGGNENNFSMEKECLQVCGRFGEKQQQQQQKQQQAGDVPNVVAQVIASASSSDGSRKCYKGGHLEDCPSSKDGDQR